MVFSTRDWCLTLKDSVPSSPARGSWLHKVEETVVSCEEEVEHVMRVVMTRLGDKCILPFSYPEVLTGLTCDRIPQVNLDQMNPRMMMNPSFCSVELQAERDLRVFVPYRLHSGLLAVRDSGGVRNYKS